MIVQKLKKSFQEDMEIAKRYYSLISALNNLEFTNREIELISYLAVTGSTSIPGNREEFCSTYNTTPATVNNMVSKLKKKGVIVKVEGKVTVNPLVKLDFSKDVGLEIKLVHGEKAK